MKSALPHRVQDLATSADGTAKTALLALCLGLAVSACDTNHPALDTEAGASSRDAAACGSGSSSQAAFDAGVEPCLHQYGELLAPATPGTFAVSYGDFLSLAPAEFSGEGVRAVVSVPASTVQATTVNGLTVDCTFADNYFCAGAESPGESPGPALRTVSVSVGDQTWTKPVGTCSPLDDRTDFWLDGLADCVDPDTVVLEGELLDYPAGEAPAARVGLFGASADLVGVELDLAFIPDRELSMSYRPCTVEGSHFTCTTLGLRQTASHKLRVQVGDYIVDKSVRLEVNGCKAQPLRADVQACPLLPDPLQVEIRPEGEEPLPPLVASASYDGGSPYPCVEVVSSTRYVARFLCPAALESPGGEGSYEIVASAGERSFRGVYERRSNGCVVSTGPLMLGSDAEPVGAEEPDAGRAESTCESEDEVGPNVINRAARDEGCYELQGYIGGPLSPGTMASNASTRMLPSETPREPARPAMLNLTREVDGVRAETKDGRTIECTHGSRYVCTDRAGIVSVSVFVGEQSWTKNIRDTGCPVYPPEDFLHFWLDDLAWCVEPGTLVLEGSLLGYDPDAGLQVSVELLGEPFGYSYLFDDELERMGATPYRPCEVSGNRYRCTTIGHRSDALHTLRIKVGDRVVNDRFWLRVEDCAAEVLQADVQACPLTPLRVDISWLGDLDVPPLQVTASHAGAAPYPCVDILPDSSSLVRHFACPAALGSDHGEGLYEVVASGGGQVLRGSYERKSDGCTATDGPLMMRR